MRKRIPAGSVIPVLVAFTLCIVAGACGQDDSTPADITGTWRAVLESPGGEIPFIIKFRNTPLSVVINNGGIWSPATRFSVKGNRIEISFMQFPDSAITGEVSADGRVIKGEWTHAGGNSGGKMPFRAERDVYDRFPPSQQVPADFSGTWAVAFNGDEEGPLQGEFLQQGDIVKGAILLPSGFYEYRFLEGRVYGNEMRLSSFDGAQAFLFIARMQKDGMIEGEEWIDESIYHGTWKATRWTADMGDPYLEMMHLTSRDGRFPFSYPDVDGNIVSQDDARFAGKALIINVTSTWGWNGREETQLLAKLYKEYRDSGLEIISLANENITDEAFKDKARHVMRYAEINGVTWPVLLVDVEVSGEEPEKRRINDKIMALYPSTFFVGRDGIVRAVHTGFNGPDTSEHYDEVVKVFRARIEEILSTSALSES